MYVIADSERCEQTDLRPISGVARLPVAALSAGPNRDRTLWAGTGQALSPPQATAEHPPQQTGEHPPRRATRPAPQAAASIKGGEASNTARAMTDEHYDPLCGTDARGHAGGLLRPHERQPDASSAGFGAPGFPTVEALKALNRRIHEDAGTSERYRLDQPAPLEANGLAHLSRADVSDDMRAVPTAETIEAMLLRRLRRSKRRP